MLDQSHDAPLLSVRDLSVVADLASGPRSIVDRVSFDLRPRQILAVIGESGSGKTVLARALASWLSAPLRASK